MKTSLKSALALGAILAACAALDSRSGNADPSAALPAADSAAARMPSITNSITLEEALARIEDPELLQRELGILAAASESREAEQQGLNSLSGEEFKQVAAAALAIAQPPDADQFLRNERDPAVRQRALNAIAAILNPGSFKAGMPSQE
jgi:hypothetical protein